MLFSTKTLSVKVALLAAAVVTLVVLACSAPAHAATFTVITTNDVAAAGSLRWAINQSELQPGADRIEFAIAGAGPHTIALTGDLPALGRRVTIDGYAQPGARPATARRSAEPMIVIDAANADRGLDIGGDRIDVRGLVVHSARYNGIFVEGRENVVAGNHIGTNAAGDAALPNGDNGIEIHGTDNAIGGSRPADRNLIAGHPIDIRVRNGTGHTIQGNRVGTNAAGTASLGYSYGMMVDAAATLVRDNLVSGEFVGIELLGDDNKVQGNLIGTTADGTATLPGGCLGMNVEGGDGNLIGGTLAGEGNVISGNPCGALQIEQGDASDPEEEIGPAVGNLVQGNFIGTDATGQIAIPNGAGWGLAAVWISGTNDNTIGGTSPGAGNVIAANEGEGVFIIGANAFDNHVVGNWIGTNPQGDLGLGNGKSGVRIDSDARRNTVGDIDPAIAANTIAHNGDDGVTIDETATDNTVVRNTIFANGSDSDDLGIDLNADGVTANDPFDGDTGANDLQNHPTIVVATDIGADAEVQWSLDSLAATSYRLEFHANDTCDSSGSGEGQTYLGTATVVTDAAGQAASTTVIAAQAGQQLSMTATRMTTGGALRETSEVSACQPVS